MSYYTSETFSRSKSRVWRQVEANGKYSGCFISCSSRDGYSFSWAEKPRQLARPRHRIDPESPHYVNSLSSVLWELANVGTLRDITLDSRHLVSIGGKRTIEAFVSKDGVTASIFESTSSIPPQE